MRMPRQDGYIVAIDDLADLQITVEHMLAIGFSFVSQLTVIRVFGLFEPAEEQKQIADTDSLMCQMTLRSVYLTESGAPVTRRWNDLPLMRGKRRTQAVKGEPL